ncbi:MAG TPA: energy transducer TonB [Marinilabiliales bacterium]|jgi:protein TonB|nr:energy transducer TonB [Salinivirgaceae bacterium]OFX37487.1 MAG: energy transducer TonB [Bacteroidetes bacterium GWA2_40_14]OFX62647.1 MAG: energy transducer TonB [Bacteroidetes bacterium GWC2_40_13]OFX74357.1 MAG: energy transducer TonB [Bacteroidetes bacterium GWD2_40_43]OFX95230.1 MAG: energy transducer TonB [Bacteroidetes bacterium GWE2_40_63]OFY21122.1 MAG: energy transducer TonB [Bacteroidetes bacterium GWF2_40_13]OFZ30897.1 MAG: energy transducer TonB [Bacteroidetes bacterium RIFOX
MELKKNPKLDLRNYSGLFLEIGFVLSLGLVLWSFNITQTEKSTSNLGELQDVVAEEEIIPITRQQQIQPPPPPEPPKVSEVLNIVEDDVEIEDELQIDDTEADQNTEVAIVEIEEEEEVEEAQVFFIVENMPEFPGGDLELRKYIAQNIQYPEIAKENGIQGRVFVQFVVNQKGEIEKVTVARGVDPSLDKEAIRVIQNLPKWKPGSQRGKPVKVSFTVPINFQLN